MPDLITAVVPVGPVPLEWWDQYTRGIQPDLYSCQLVFAKLPDLVEYARGLEAENEWMWGMLGTAQVVDAMAGTGERAALANLVDRCKELEAEVARLREMHAHRCERVAAQSELLSRRAERKADGADLAAEFLKPDLGGEGG